TGVAPEVDLLGGETVGPVVGREGPAGGVEGPVTGDGHRAALPRVLDHAAERQDGGEPDQADSRSEETTHDLAATEGRGLPGVVEFGDDGAPVDLVRRPVVACLDRDLL